MDKTKGLNYIFDKLKSIVNNSKVPPAVRKVLKEIRWEMKSYTEKKSDNNQLDGLTNLYNHISFHDLLEKELERAKRDKQPMALCFFDIDLFKNINDTMGHSQGDEVLKTMANLLKSSMRSYDIISRYGGDEFTLIMPNTERSDAYTIVDRFRKKILKHDFQLKSKLKSNIQRPNITMSAGIASYPINGLTSSQLIDRADKALYMAKEEGRNRVSVSSITTHGRIKFAFCPPSLSPFYSNMLRGIREVADDIGNVDVIALDSGSDLNFFKQGDNLKKAVNMKIDALAVFSKIDMKDNIKKANKNKIKVFGFYMKYMKMDSGSRILSYIICDQYEAGRKVGKYLVRLLRHKGEVAVLEGVAGERDSIERKEGFLKIIKKYPDIKVVKIEAGDWMKDKARKISKGILKEHPGLDAFFCTNDQMAIGVSETVNKLEKKGQIFVIGYDGTQEALQAIQREDVTATLSTVPYNLGKVLMRTVIRSTMKEEKIEKIITSPSAIVDAENVEEYLL